MISYGCPAEAWREFETRFGVKIIELYGMSYSKLTVLFVLLFATQWLNGAGRPAITAQVRLPVRGSRTVAPSASRSARSRA